MQDVFTRITRLERPRLLSRAARAGAPAYRRDVHLPRLLGAHMLPRHKQALTVLADLEAELEAQRKEGDTSYSVSKHIDVLIALVAEAHLLRNSAYA